MSDPTRVIVWNEFRQEKTDEPVKAVYPDGIHRAIASHLEQQSDLRVQTATMDEPEHGLPEERLATTDVLVWWGHHFQREVSDGIAGRVAERVHDGMGLLVLHSAHFAKPFIRLMGTSCRMDHWNVGTTERLYTLMPEHPIAAGVEQGFALDETEMYSEFFDVPPPDEVVFLSRFGSGEVFRSGCTWSRGKGTVVYFRPGHETFPLFYHPNVLRVITNAVCWLGNPRR